MIETTVCNITAALTHAIARLALSIELPVTDMTIKMMSAQATAYFACTNAGSELISADRIKVAECILLCSLVVSSVEEAREEKLGVIVLARSVVST